MCIFPVSKIVVLGLIFAHHRITQNNILLGVEVFIDQHLVNVCFGWLVFRKR